MDQTHIVQEDGPVPANGAGPQAVAAPAGLQRTPALRSVWLVGGAATSATMLAVLYGAVNSLAALVTLAWFGLPGIAFAWRRCGASSPGFMLASLAAGWAGSLVAIALAGMIVGRFDPAWVLALPLLVAVPAFLAAGRAAPGATAAPDPGATAWFAASMVVGLVLAWPALSHVGQVTDIGVNFRPFFNADFFKHAGIALGFLQGEFPPRDLFGHGGSVQYYWLQHVLPASILALLPGDADPFPVLGAVGGWQTVMLGALLFTWARRFTAQDSTAFLITLVALASLSLDGLASFISTNRWLEPARTLNMEPLDVTTSLFLAPDRILASTLYRLNLYIPQHQLCAIFLVAWCLLLPGRGGLDAGRWDRGALVAAMPATSLLMGLPALGMVALVVAANWWRRRELRVIDAAGAALGLLLPLLTSMISLGSSAARLSTEIIPVADVPAWLRLAWLPVQLVTSFGFLMPLALIGVVAVARTRDPDDPGGSAPTLALLLAITGFAASAALLPLTFLRLDVQLKLSFILGVALVPLAAAAISSGWLGSRRRWRIGLGVLLLLGLPSPVHDTIWHSCETPVCRTTPWQSTTIPLADWRALTWIRENTPRGALFQQSPQPDFLAGGPDVWIPVVAGRPIYASRRGSRSGEPDIERARRLFDPATVELTSTAARRLGIEYLYLSHALERESFEAMQLKLATDPGLQRIYADDGVSIWRVGREP